MWGGNQYGQLGTNNRTSYSSPVQTVSAGSNWRQIDCGSGTHSLAIKTDGTLWGWGRNSNGELGLNDNTNKSSPVQVTGGGTTWQDAGATYRGAVAIKTDGTIWSWGIANAGIGAAQLGDSTTVSRSSPVQIGANKGTWLKVSAGGYFGAGIAY
jgi:alpha-tubulin suppressor-like RCC1 family protein